MIRGAAILAGLALLAACAAPANDVTPGPDAEAQAPAGGGDRVAQPEWDVLDRVDDTCGLEALKPWLGKPSGDLPEGTLKARDRILSPDSQATMDYAPDRLNVLTNDDGIIIGLKCG
ncbi:MAG: I78 family peptidase inhibitor [Hyphomonas sp.]|uniref:I78 family peptidase inhibitor n=1 Tax=Hyphomonas sp. TaxID=87 RepID=UPI0035279041